MYLIHQGKSILIEMSWNEFGTIVYNLSTKIRKEYHSDVIIGIGRSGSIPASILAKLLKVDRLLIINVQLYNEDKPPRQIYDKPRVTIQGIPDLNGERILLVDDFARSGSTINAALKAVRDKSAEEVKSAVMAVRKDAKIKPDYTGIIFDDCVIFPWDLK
jgi:hypoxanthine phosphoribosyltransferase